MSCFNCRFYTGEDYLACGVDPITAATSPEEGCRDWRPNPNPWGFWEILLNPPHVDDVQIGWVPIDGWQQLSCPIVDILLFEDIEFTMWTKTGSVVVGNSLWRDPQGRIVGYAQAWDLEYRDWYSDPDPLSGSGQMVLWLRDLLNY